MTAGILFVLGFMLLADQLMGLGRSGAWPSITLASELGVPADRVFSDWIILDKPIQFVLGEVQLWIVLIFAAALIYWVTDWAGEMLDRTLSGKRPPPFPQEPELADSGKSV
jgi:type III secretory pathway component EscT